MTLQSLDTNYLRSMRLCSALYFGLLYLAWQTIQVYHPQGLPLYLLVTAPSLPIGAMILLLVRHIEEVDEYVRSVMLKRFVTATGLLLAMCAFLGFWEDFGGGPHLSLFHATWMFWILFSFARIVHRQAS